MHQCSDGFGRLKPQHDLRSPGNTCSLESLKGGKPESTSPEKTERPRVSLSDERRRERVPGRKSRSLGASEPRGLGPSLGKDFAFSAARPLSCCEEPSSSGKSSKHRPGAQSDLLGKPSYAAGAGGSTGAAGASSGAQQPDGASLTGAAVSEANKDGGRIECQKLALLRINQRNLLR